MSRSLYNNPTVEKLLSTVENQNFERKTAYIQQKDLTAEFSAFANSSVEGGLIALGIEKDKNVIGINIVGQTKINKLVQAQNVFCPLAKVTHKEVEIINNKGLTDRLLLFYVEFSPDRVVKLISCEAYKRIGDQTCKMLPEEIRQMEYDKREAEFEKELIHTLTIAQLNEDLMKSFIKRWIERDGLANEPSVEDLILMKGFGRRKREGIKINYAGVLLFYDRPDEFIPGAKIRFLKYEGIRVETGVRSNIVKDKYFDGPITQQIVQLAEMVKSQIREFSFLGKDGKFKTVLEYPEFAWYEAVVNAVAHRAYNLKNTNIFVRMFNDHIEIESPGNLPGIVTIENIYKESFPRNPTLMQGLLYLGFVKFASEGMDRIKEEMINSGLPEPGLQDDKNATLFKVILRNNIEKRIVKSELEDIKELNQEIVESLNEDEKKIVYYLLKNRIGAPADFEKEINKGRATVVRRLRRLEKLQAAERTEKVGPNVRYKLTPQILSMAESNNDNQKGMEQAKLL